MATDQRPLLPNASTTRRKHNKPRRNSGTSKCCCACAADLRQEDPDTACRSPASSLRPSRRGPSIDEEGCCAKTGNYTRCRLHGGASTGPRATEGLERCRRARWQHETSLRLRNGGAQASCSRRARGLGEYSIASNGCCACIAQIRLEIVGAAIEHDALRRHRLSRRRRYRADRGHRKGMYVRSRGRKVTGMFNSSAACISLTPQLHASYPHCNSLKVYTVVVSHETFSGHRVLAGSYYGTATNCSILLSEIIAVHGVLRDLRLENWWLFYEARTDHNTLMRAASSGGPSRVVLDNPNMVNYYCTGAAANHGGIQFSTTTHRRQPLHLLL
jgi:hypothetical protein